MLDGPRLFFIPDAADGEIETAAGDALGAQAMRTIELDKAIGIEALPDLFSNLFQQLG